MAATDVVRGLVQAAVAVLVVAEALARVSSFDWMGSLALLPVGFALAGPIGDALGAREVLVAGGLLTVACTAAVLLSADVRGLTSRTPPPATPG